MVELSSQSPAVSLHTLSLPPQGLDVALEQRLHVALTALAVLVELPLGLQQLVLLLQEAHLPFRGAKRLSGNLGSVYVCVFESVCMWSVCMWCVMVCACDVYGVWCMQGVCVVWSVLYVCD